jgi:histidinol-phosphate aminotransferase
MLDLQIERERLCVSLSKLNAVTRVYNSDANFILAKMKAPSAALERAARARILVRDARSYMGLEKCLRVSVGTAAQNNRLIRAWR